MNHNFSEKIKKALSFFITALLIISTILCLVLVAKSVSGGNVSLFGYRIFYIVTGSMEPTIHAGAITVVKNDPDGSYKPGDVITFKSKDSEIYGQPNTHRIVRTEVENGTTFYVTKGDANDTEDSALISSSDIYGRVIWYSGKMTWLGSVLGFLMTPVGFLLVVLLPVLLLAVSQMKEFTRTYKEALAEAARQSLISEEERNGQNDKPEEKQ